MYYRKIISELRAWRNSTGRKPLVLRGARQVGKTTVVEQFAADFSQFIHLNLERDADRELFVKYKNVDELLQAMFFKNNKSIDLLPDTLLFIDEIQELPEAVAMLRYFYEDFPALNVVAAGSLLENMLGRSINFPVGRVEYRVLRPVSFAEFLEAMGENQALQMYETIPLPDFAFDKLLSLFHAYTLIGGMPEVVAKYINNRDLTALPNVYESLLGTYFNDIEKYAQNSSQIQIFRHAIRAAFYEAGSRIKFAGFGASNYGSKDMGEVLRTLEKVMLLHLIYPTVQTEKPFKPDIKKSPRLQVLDTGMLNFFSGLQKEIFGTRDLNDFYQGRITEHIVGQEFLAAKFNLMNELRFWVREKKQSSAETDFLFPFDGEVFPVEIKSGAGGRMRSLFLYLDNSKCDFAVRFYAGKISLEEHKTIAGKPFRLLSLPYFLAGNLENYLKHFI